MVASCVDGNAPIAPAGRGAGVRVNTPAGSEGVYIDIFGAQNATIAVQNEDMGTQLVPSGLWHGISAFASGSAQLRLTVADNTIALDPNNTGGNYALYVDMSPDLTPSTICMNLHHNDISPAVSYVLWVAQRDPGIFAIDGLLAPGNAAAALTYLFGRNPLFADLDASFDVSGNFVPSAGACPVP